MYLVKTSGYVKIPRLRQKAVKLTPCLRQKYLKIICYWAARPHWEQIRECPPGTSTKTIFARVGLDFRVRPNNHCSVGDEKSVFNFSRLYCFPSSHLSLFPDFCYHQIRITYCLNFYFSYAKHFIYNIQWSMSAAPETNKSY